MSSQKGDIEGAIKSRSLNLRGKVTPSGSMDNNNKPNVYLSIFPVVLAEAANNNGPKGAHIEVEKNRLPKCKCQVKTTLSATTFEKLIPYPILVAKLS